MEQKIIVYRSQNEKLMDEFWTENPNLALGFIGIVVGAFVLIAVWQKLFPSTKYFR